MEVVSGLWRYFAETRGMTEANFSLDIPVRAIKFMTYENDIVLDPFMGSGTTAVAAVNLDRKYIGFEISKNIDGGTILNISSDLGLVGPDLNLYKENSI